MALSINLIKQSHNGQDDNIFGFSFPREYSDAAPVSGLLQISKLLCVEFEVHNQNGKGSAMTLPKIHNLL